MSGADVRQVRITALREVRRVALGLVQVWERSPGKASSRDMGELSVDMSPVADLLEDGGSEADADELAREIYAAAYFGDVYGGDFPIEIVGYRQPPEFF